MRRFLWFVCAVGLLDTVFYAALTPLLPHLVDSFAASKSQAGVLTAAYALGAGLAALPAGLLAVRWRVRPIVAAGLATVASATVLFGFAQSLWLLDLSRFLQGVGDAMAWTGALAWLVLVAPRERRGELLGIAIAAAIAGSLLGPVLGSAAALVGRAETFTAVATLALGLLVWGWLSPDPSSRGNATVAGLRRALREPAVVAGAWFITVGTLLSGTISVLVPLHLDTLGWGPTAIGAVFLTAAAIQAALAPVLGRWSDRRGRRGPLRAGLLASAVLASLLPWPSLAWLLALVVLACSTALTFLLVPGMAMLTEGAEHAGLQTALAVSLLTLTWAPGQVIGAALGGALASATTDALPFLLLAALATLTTLHFHRSNPIAKPGKQPT